jgi:hypothetical protein
MPTLQSVLAEAQAIDTTQLEGVPAAVAQIITDLQALIAAAPAPAADPVVSFTETHQSGATVVFPVTQS